MIDTATIVVADHCLDDIELLKLAFAKAGLKNPVHCLAGGNDVIAYLGQGAKSATDPFPLLMFLDLKMAHGTGYAVLDWLQQQPSLRHLPTIVFSNSDHAADIENSFRRGASGYWVKPASLEELVSKVRGLQEILNRITRQIELDLAPAPIG